MNIAFSKPFSDPSKFMLYAHFPVPTLEEFKSATSETAKYRHLVVKYCEGIVLDIGSQGNPVVPWAWSLDLPSDKFARYAGADSKGAVQLRGDCRKLPVDDESLDTVFSSHLLEDFALISWSGIIAEWARCLRKGGYMVIIVPEVNLWRAAVAAGQPPNANHLHEAEMGDLSKAAIPCGLVCVEERLTNVHPGDYSLLGVFQKP